MPLNDQERRFAQELVKGCSIAEAARKAGYAESTAKGDAAMWLQHGDTRYKPELAEYIDELRNQVEDHTIASKREVLQYLTKVIRTKISDTSEYDGYALKPKSFEEMGEHIDIVDGIEWSKGQYAKIHNAKKIDAAKELAKFHSLTTKTQTELNGKIETEIIEDYSNLTLEEKKQLLALKRKARGQGGNKPN